MKVRTFARTHLHRGHTSTLVPGINYFVVMTRPLHPIQVRYGELVRSFVLLNVEIRHIRYFLQCSYHILAQTFSIIPMNDQGTGI